MEEKEVKNEVPAPETVKGKEPEKQEKEKKELTPQQIQQRKKMLVYPLMGLVFLGAMYLIFALSEKDEAKVENVGGFNADIPQPKGDGIISDKKTAYEQEQMENKQADKMRSLQDFAFSLGEENGNGEDLTLIDDAPAEKPKNAVIDFGAGAPNNTRSSIQSSAAAYRDMNRQLGSFYETPKEDKEKEELKRQVEELTARLDAKESGAGSMDEQVALMEKSYELAAKYMNGQNGQSSQPGQIAQVTPSAPIQEKGSTASVKAVSDRTVSGLQQPMSNSEFIAEYGKPRNYGFNTAVGSGYSIGKNTIRACVHNDQTLMDGQTVKLRLLEPLQAGNFIFRKTALYREVPKFRVNGSKYWCPRSNMRVTSFRWNLPFTTVTGKRGFPFPRHWNRKRQKKRWRISVRDWVRVFPLRKVPGSRSQWILQEA